MNGSLRVLGLLALLASPALGAEAYCEPSIDLDAANAKPELYVVRAGVEKSFFQIDGHNGEPCPSADPVCRANAYLIAGDFVVVTSVTEGYVCAAFTNEGKENITTAGWLPADEVEPVTLPAARPEDFAGHWASGPEQFITVVVESGRLLIDGEATFGAMVPERVESGRVNEGGISADLVPEGNLAAWTDPNDGTTQPWVAGDADYNCTVRLWALPPFLVAASNQFCGGQGVTFSGVYAPTD